MMENLFDCLSCLLLFTPNRERFLKGEGLQLMNLVMPVTDFSQEIFILIANELSSFQMLREKKVSRNGALKVLDHALIGPEGKDSCAKFVDILGLRTIFPLFMKTPKKQKRKGVSAEEHEEHVISIVASLMKNCKSSQRQRLLAKFTESDHEKVERVMEMHFKYLDRVSSVEVGEEEDEDMAYMKRLDSGLFSLQLVDFIIADAYCNGAPTIKQRIIKILNQRNASLAAIKNVLREYADNIGDTDDNADAQEAKEEERNYILRLVDKL